MERVSLCFNLSQIHFKIHSMTWESSSKWSKRNRVRKVSPLFVCFCHLWWSKEDAESCARSPSAFPFTCCLSTWSCLNFCHLIVSFHASWNSTMWISGGKSGGKIERWRKKKQELSGIDLKPVSNHQWVLIKHQLFAAYGAVRIRVGAEGSSRTVILSSQSLWSGRGK